MGPGYRARARITVSTRVWLCLGLALIACRSPEPPPISIGLNPWIGFEYLHLAERHGFFADEGVNVRLVEFASIHDVTRAFQRAQVDAFGASPVDLLHTIDQGSRQLRVFQVLDFSNGADVVLARKPIADVAGLRGARVAVEPGTVTTFLLVRALESAGLTLDDVMLLPTDQLQMFDVFVAGQVDAVVTFPPVSSLLLATGQAHPVFSSERVPGEIVDFLAMDARLLQERPDAAAAILRAFDRAVEFAEANPSEAHAFMAARLHMKPEEVATLLEKGIHITPLAEQEALLAPGGPLASSLQTNVEILRRTGQLSRALELEGLLEDEPLRRALAARREGKSVPRSER